MPSEGMHRNGYGTDVAVRMVGPTATAASAGGPSSSLQEPISPVVEMERSSPKEGVKSGNLGGRRRRIMQQQKEEMGVQSSRRRRRSSEGDRSIGRREAGKAFQTRGSLPPHPPLPALPSDLLQELADDDERTERLTGPTAPLSSILSAADDEADGPSKEGVMSRLTRRRSSAASAHAAKKGSTPRNLSSAADKVLGLAHDDNSHNKPAKQFPLQFDWLAAAVNRRPPDPPQNSHRRKSHSPTRSIASSLHRSLASEAEAAHATNTHRRARRLAKADAAATAAAVTANAKQPPKTPAILQPAHHSLNPHPPLIIPVNNPALNNPALNTSAALPPAAHPRLTALSMQRATSIAWSKASSLTNSAATDPSAGLHSVAMEDAVKARADARRQSRLAFAAEFLDSALKESTSLASPQPHTTTIPTTSTDEPYSHNANPTPFHIPTLPPTSNLPPPANAPASDRDPVERATMAQRERLWSRSGDVIRNMDVVLEGSTSSASHEIELHNHRNIQTHHHHLGDGDTFDDIGTVVRNLRFDDMTDEQSRIWRGVETLLTEAFSESSTSSYSNQQQQPQQQQQTTRHHHNDKRPSVISSSSNSSSSSALDLLDKSLQGYVRSQISNRNLKSHRPPQFRQFSDDLYLTSNSLDNTRNQNQQQSKNNAIHDKHPGQDALKNNNDDDDENDFYPTHAGQKILPQAPPKIKPDSNDSSFAEAALGSFASFFAPDLSRTMSPSSSLSSPRNRRPRSALSPRDQRQIHNDVFNLLPRDDIASSISPSISSMEILRSSLRALMTHERRMQRSAAKAAVERAASLAARSIFEEDDGKQDGDSEIGAPDERHTNQNNNEFDNPDDDDDVETNRELALDALNAMANVLLDVEEQQSTSKSLQSPTPSQSVTSILSEEDVESKASMLTGARKKLFDLFHWSLRVNIDEQERQRMRMKRHRKQRRLNSLPVAKADAQQNTQEENEERSSLEPGRLAIILDEENESDDENKVLDNKVVTNETTSSPRNPDTTTVESNVAEATTNVAADIMKGVSPFMEEDDDGDDDEGYYDDILDVSPADVIDALTRIMDPRGSIQNQDKTSQSAPRSSPARRPTDTAPRPPREHGEDNVERDDKMQLLHDIAYIGSFYGMNTSDRSIMSTSSSPSRVSSTAGGEQTASGESTGTEIQANMTSRSPNTEQPNQDQATSRSPSNASGRSRASIGTGQERRCNNSNENDQLRDDDTESLSHFSPMSWRQNGQNDDGNDAVDDGDDHHPNSLVEEDDILPSANSIVEVTLIGEAALLNSVSDGSMDSVSFRKAPLPLSALKRAFANPLDSFSASSLASSQQPPHHPGPSIRSPTSTALTNRDDAHPDSDSNPHELAAAPYDSHIASLVGSALDLLTTVTNGSDDSPDSLAALRDRVPCPTAFELAFAVTLPGDKKKSPKAEADKSNLSASGKSSNSPPQEIKIRSRDFSNNKDKDAMEEEVEEDSREIHEIHIPASPSTVWDSVNGDEMASLASSTSPSMSKAARVERFEQSFTISATSEERSDGNGGRVLERTVSIRSMGSNKNSIIGDSVDTSKLVDQGVVEISSSPSRRPTLYKTGVSFSLRSITRTSSINGGLDGDDGRSEEIQATSIDLEVIESLSPNLPDKTNARNNAAGAAVITEKINSTSLDQNVSSSDIAEKYSPTAVGSRWGFGFVPVFDDEPSSSVANSSCRPRRVRFRNPPRRAASSVWKGKWFVIRRTRRSSSSSAAGSSLPSSPQQRPAMDRGISRHALLEYNDFEEATNNTTLQNIVNVGFGLITDSSSEPPSDAESALSLSSSLYERSVFTEHSRGSTTSVPSSGAAV